MATHLSPQKTCLRGPCVVKSTKTKSKMICLPQLLSGSSLQLSGAGQHNFLWSRAWVWKQAWGQLFLSYHRWGTWVICTLRTNGALVLEATCEDHSLCDRSLLFCRPRRQGRVKTCDVNGHSVNLQFLSCIIGEAVLPRYLATSVPCIHTDRMWTRVWTHLSRQIQPSCVCGVVYIFMSVCICRPEVNIPHLIALKYVSYWIWRSRI